MRPELHYLNENDLKKVHTLSLELLEDMGMVLETQEARDYFEKAGATVEKNIVKIPRKIIEEALATVPKRDEFVLYGREEKYDYRLNEDLPTLVGMPAATSIIDPYTRSKRKPSYEDLVNLTKIQEIMGTLTIAGGIITPQDVPLETSDWYTWAALIKNTGKHICGSGVGKVGVRDAVAMAQLAMGDAVAFEDRPWLSFWILTSPPMRLAENALNVLIEASLLNAPMEISSGGILGISSPMTIESAVIQTHAENLATIALTQLVRPGVSIMYSTFVRSMDMKTMSVAMASPETAILKSMTAELGRYLDLPTMMPTCLRDSKIIDAQAGFETGMVGTIGAYNSDFLIGLQLDSDLLVDYADLPYTNECMEQFRRLVGKFDFNDKRIAMDNIKKVGHGESYLNSKHTAKNFRKELWVSDLTERGDWNAWKKDGGKSIAEKSEERVIQLLKQVKDVELLSKAICDKIDQIADGAGEKVKNIKR